MTCSWTLAKQTMQIWRTQRTSWVDGLRAGEQENWKSSVVGWTGSKGPLRSVAWRLSRQADRGTNERLPYKVEAWAGPLWWELPKTGQLVRASVKAGPHRRLMMTGEFLRIQRRRQLWQRQVSSGGREGYWGPKNGTTDRVTGWKVKLRSRQWRLATQAPGKWQSGWSLMV